MTLQQQILRIILERPGTRSEAFSRLFDLTAYRLNRVFRHIERDLHDQILVRHDGNGVWIVDLDPSICHAMLWSGSRERGYVQCRGEIAFSDQRCYEHTQHENPEMVAFKRLLAYLAGPAEPSARTLSQLALAQVEDLLHTLERISPKSRRDQDTKRRLAAAILAARAHLKWRDEMRRRRAQDRWIPPEFEERHWRSSGNTYEYSLKKHYVVLEIPEQATKEEVLKAWRRLARRFHPDAAGGDEERMKAINLAKEKIFRIKRWD
ncbi:MAG: DnaJ domain-containing protein [Desulfomonile tiedjei]|nr:DnaJ domain-containing protein [Desulfomonile tiedjei]